MVNPLALSDEDFLKAGPPPEVEASDIQNQQQTTVPEDTTDEPEEESTPVETPKTEPEANPEQAAPTATPGGEQVADPSKAATETDPGKVDVPADKGNPASQEKPVIEADKSTANPPNYQEMYDQLMAPFTANGKTIKLNTPEELRQLAQMGTNYTKKMQELAPQRKVLAMLQNNGLLDEGKLNFLIDLSNKNPEAIKKLVKEAGINPLDIDVNAEPAYVAGAHQISDKEITFRTALEETMSTPEGTALISDIEAKWDSNSKDVLYSQPELLEVFRQQKQNGVYQVIAENIERQRILGNIPTSMPFLQAYKAVGDKLTAEGGFNHLKQAAPAIQGNTSPAAPVVTRPAAPKPPVKNSKLASAASVTRSTPREAKTFVNPLAMSDEEFMKLK